MPEIAKTEMRKTKEFVLQTSYAERLRILVDRSRKFGSEPIFVTQPSRKYRLTMNGVEGCFREFTEYILKKWGVLSGSIGHYTGPR
jgi:hypothetical protein